MIFIGKNTDSFIVKCLLIVFSISISYLLGAQNRNLLLICIMSLSPLAIIRYPYICKTDFILLLLILSILIPVMVFNPSTLRWSTILYSVMFCLTFVGYMRVLNESSFEVFDYLSLIKCLIYAYCIVLIMQQLCVLLHIPIINVSNYNIFNKWKLNSLGPEPSHSAVYVSILMYSYLITKERYFNKKISLRSSLKSDTLVWLSYLWTMLTMISGTAILYLCIILTKYLNKKNLFIIFSLALVLIPLHSIIRYEPLSRTISTLQATITLNEKKIIETDLSAAFRIVPSITAIKNIDFSKSDTWTGKGVDFMKRNLIHQLPAVDKNTPSISTAFTLCADYGMIFFLIWCVFTFTVCTNSAEPITYLLWFFGVMLNGINMQITWFILIFLYTNRYFDKNGKNNAGIWNSPRGHKDGSISQRVPEISS